MDSLPPLGFFFLFSGWVNRHQQAVIDYLLEENRVLRATHGPRRLCLTDDQRRRLAVKGEVLGRRRLADIAGIVRPDTILRWYRRLVAKKYDGSKTRRPGRPRTKPDLAALVVRMATENPTWGYTRIRGGLKSLGHNIARNTIKAILNDHGIEPAPERGTKTPWKTFLAAHWDGLAAADFLTVEVLTIAGLVRYVVFFVMRLKTRAVEIAGITRQPHEAWVAQIARNPTDTRDGFLRDTQYLILDRDPLYTAAFRRLLRGSGVNPLVLPARSPNLNAFAERFVESAKSECLERIVPLGEGHLRAAVRAFVEHYHEERPHQGLGNELIAPKTTSIGTGPVKCRARLGGLLKFYYREAASPWRRSFRTRRRPRDAGLHLRVLKTPARVPQANAFCERLIGTARRECLDHLIPLHERHLRKILAEWVPHYNRGRPHASLGPGIPEPSGLTVWRAVDHTLPHEHRVVAKPILAGLHHEYRLEPIAA